MRDFCSVKASSCVRYAGFTLTSAAPTRAQARCTSIHSAQLVDHSPTRSPLRTPSDAKPRATASVASRSSRQV